MAILLDDVAVDLPGENLSEVLEAAQRQLDASQRVIVEVQVAGQTLDSEQLEQAMGIAVADQQISLYSASPRDIATTTLAAVRDRLSEAKAIQDEAAELLQQDQAAQALEKVSSLIEIWLQTQQAVVQSATLMQIELSSLTADDQTMDAVAQDLVQKLMDLKQSIVSKDTVGLADTLSYEWPETVDRWDALVSNLIARIED